MEALEMFKCFRLAARIEELRAQGHKIITQTVSRNGKEFANYLLVE